MYSCAVLAASLGGSSSKKKPKFGKRKNSRKRGPRKSTPNFPQPGVAERKKDEAPEMFLLLRTKQTPRQSFLVLPPSRRTSPPSAPVVSLFRGSHVLALGLCLRWPKIGKFVEKPTRAVEMGREPKVWSLSCPVLRMLRSGIDFFSTFRCLCPTFGTREKREERGRTDAAQADREIYGHFLFQGGRLLAASVFGCQISTFPSF